MVRVLSTDRRVNNDVNYVEVEKSKKKNFYAIGFDKKLKKSFLTTIENVTKLEAKREGATWAKANGLVLEGVYAN